MDYTTIEPNRVKHLEMIQAAIDKIGRESFVLKGWTITVSGAFFGIAISRNDARIAWGGIFPILVFCAVDSYFARA